MSFKSFTKYVLGASPGAASLLHEHPISELLGRQIVIDGRSWLSRLAVEVSHAATPNSALCDGMGVAPFLLHPCLERLLEPLAALTADIVFVFDGLTQQHRAPQILAKRSREYAEDVARLWTQSVSGKSPEEELVRRCVKRACFTENAVASVMEYLLQKGVEVMRAPYSSRTQISFLIECMVKEQREQRKKPICFGDPELLLFGVDEVVLAINGSEYLSVRLLDVLQSGDSLITFQQLVDAAAIHKALETVSKDRCPSFLRVLESRKDSKEAFSSIEPELKMMDVDSSKPELITSEYHNVRSLLYEQPVLDPETCTCRDSALAKTKLPEEVYFFICMGFLSPNVVQPFIDKRIMLPPTIADSDLLGHVEVFLNRVKERYTSVFASACQADHHLVLCHWSDDEKATPHENCFNLILNPQPYNFRSISGEDMSTEFARQGVPPGITSIDISFILQCQRHAQEQGKGALASHLTEKQPPITSVQSALCHVLITGECCVNYLTTDNTSPMTPFGEALCDSLRMRETGSELSEETLTIMELARDEDLLTTPFAPLQVPIPLTRPEDRKEVALLSRVFSLVPLDSSTEQMIHKEVLSSSSILPDFSLSAFNVVVQSLWRELRYLFETVFVSLSLQNIICVPPSQCRGLYDRLPFKRSPTTTLGLILQHIVCCQKKDVKSLEDCFPSGIKKETLIRIDQALDNGVHFWKHVRSVISMMASRRLVTESLQNLFESSDRFLEEKLQSMKMETDNS